MAVTPANKSLSNDGQNSWTEYRRLVLAELERLSTALAGVISNGNNMQMSMTQALNDARHIIIEKLRETIKTAEDEYERRLKELDDRHLKQVGHLRKSVEQTDKKLEKTDKELTSLKAKAVMLGALAGFLVAIVGVVASIFIKK